MKLRKSLATKSKRQHAKNLQTKDAAVKKVQKKNILLPKNLRVQRNVQSQKNHMTQANALN